MTFEFWFDFFFITRLRHNMEKARTFTIKLSSWICKYPSVTGLQLNMLRNVQ